MWSSTTATSAVEKELKERKQGEAEKWHKITVKLFLFQWTKKKKIKMTWVHRSPQEPFYKQKYIPLCCVILNL